MMTEISLNILDVAENSTQAGADFITILVAADTEADTLTVRLTDNGCGMTKEEVSKVTDPFYTSRNTRRVGLGIPFFQYAAECTGGTFTIESEPGTGTKVTAMFGLSHIDRMPLGDINSTIETLITCHPGIDFLYIYRYNKASFELNTRKFREILYDIPFDTPEVSAFIKEYLCENKLETDGGAVF